MFTKQEHTFNQETPCKGEEKGKKHVQGHAQQSDKHIVGLRRKHLRP